MSCYYLAVHAVYMEALPITWWKSPNHALTTSQSRKESKDELPTPAHTPKKQKSELDLARKILKGTEIEHALKTDIQHLQSDYMTIVKPISDRHGWNISFELFQRVSTLVASRCFDVDSFHGDSMVMIADLFNHEVEEDVHLESFDPADDSETENEDEQEGSEEEFENEDFVAEEKEDSSVIEMRLIKPVKKGQEIYNTYGQHSNAYLFLKYGFTCENNPYNVVSVSTDLILSLFEDKERIIDRVVWWIRHGKRLAQSCVEDDDEDGEQDAHFEFEDFNGDDESQDESEEQEYEDFYHLQKGKQIPFEMTCFITALIVSPEFLEDGMQDEFIEICRSNHVLETMHSEFKDILEKAILKRAMEYNRDTKVSFKVTDDRLRHAIKILDDELSIIDDIQTIYFGTGQ